MFTFSLLAPFFNPSRAILPLFHDRYLTSISTAQQANLVDITYLLDQGALIDFTSVELANLVRALFASSEKRDAVVQRIEREGTGGQGVAGISTN